MSKILANPDIVIREEYDDWGLLYNPTTAKVYSINPSGIAIYKLLQSSITIEDIVNALRERYVNMPDDITETVNAFIEFLIDKNLASYPDRDE